MKKRITALILTLCILSSMALSVFAQNGEEKFAYYRLNVVRDNVTGITLAVDFMIPGDKSGVYVNAEQLADLSEAYIFEFTPDQCALVNADTQHALMFKFDSKSVVSYLAGTVLEYDSPIPAMYVDGIVWLPFDFAMTILGCTYYLAENNALVTSPSALNVLSVLATVFSADNDFSFSWIDEVGYSEEAVNTMSISSTVVDFFSGLLSFESRSWMTLLTCLTDGTAAYDASFSRNIADLFISPSLDELEGLSSDVSTVSDIISPGGDLAEAIKAQGKALDLNVGSLWDSCEALKKNFVNNPAAVMTYNCTYKQLEAAMESQENFRKSTGFISNFQNKMDFLQIDDDTSYLDIAAMGLDILNYSYQFQNRDETALRALKGYCSQSSLGAGKSDAMLNVVTAYENSETEWDYAVNEYFTDNWDELLSSKIPMHKLLGAKANILLVGWSLASNLIPFFRDGLDSTNNFKLSEYAIEFQDESSIFCNRAEASCLFSGSINESKLDDLVESTYTYLKFSSIARDSAIASMKSGALDASIKNQMVSQMTAKNVRIGRYLAVLSQALEGTDNSNGAYGFLPSENRSYLSAWDDSDMIEYLESGVGESIPKSTQAKTPIYEIANFPGEKSKNITEDEAIALVKKAAGRSMAGLFDTLFADIYVFECVDTYAVDDKLCYVIKMTVVDSTADDGYRFFVPSTGEAVWMGMIDSSEDYYCYSSLDLLNLSWSSLATSLTDLYNEIEREAAGGQ